ncbi:hypothetical protein BDW62DRAFT_102817 [Aspergillus aurantiobrunneus]
MEFPIISIKHVDSDFNTISKQIFKASQDWGFFIVTDHAIDNASPSRMFTLSRQFFDLPMDIKRKHTLDITAVGYDGHKATTFTASEGMAFGLPAGQLLQSNNIHAWWDPAKLQEIEAFKAQCSALALQILSCFAVNMGLERDFFAASHAQPVLPGNALKFMKYPKLTNQQQQQLKQPDDTTTTPTVARLSEHTDWGTLTLLFTETPGLEVRDLNNNWHNVPVVPSGIVVNIGDALSLWTNKQLKSTPHRISWEKVPADQERYSMPYFVQPSFDTDLQPLTAPAAETKAQQPPPPPPLTYKDYYDVRIRMAWGSILDEDGKAKTDDAQLRVARYLARMGFAPRTGLLLEDGLSV